MNYSRRKERLEGESEHDYLIRRNAEARTARETVNSWFPDDEYNCIEITTAEILALQLTKGKPNFTKAVEQTREVMCEMFKDEPEKLEIVLDAIPTAISLNDKYKKSKRFYEFVWSKIKNTSLFNQTTRFEVINALVEAAKNGNVNAAKVYLTMTGDFSDKSENGVGRAGQMNDTDKFAEIQKALNTPLKSK